MPVHLRMELEAEYWKTLVLYGFDDSVFGGRSDPKSGGERAATLRMRRIDAKAAFAEKLGHQRRTGPDSHLVFSPFAGAPEAGGVLVD